jgi:hypothetical protein
LHSFYSTASLLARLPACCWFAFPPACLSTWLPAYLPACLFFFPPFPLLYFILFYFIFFFHFIFAVLGVKENILKRRMKVNEN